MTTSRQVQIRRGTTTENASFVGAQGELTFDTTANVLILHDGFTVGGHRLDAASLPTASPTQLGGIKIGPGLSIDGNGVATSTATYSLPVATANVLGGIKLGTGLTMDPLGVVSVIDNDIYYALLTGAVFTGNISAPTVTGNTVTGSNAVFSGSISSNSATFTGNISALNLSGTNTGDQNLSGYALLSGATFTGNVSTPNVNVTSIHFSDSTYQTTAALSYTLPISGPATLGGVKVGTSLEINGNGVLDVANNLTLSGNIAAANLSGHNTGDQNLAPYALLAGATFTGNISALNFSGNSSGVNTGDQNLAPYALTANLSAYAPLAGATFTGNISALNFSGNSSGVNTGDQNLSGYALLSGATFSGNVTAANVNISAGGVLKFSDNTTQSTASHGSANVYDSAGVLSDSAIYTGNVVINGTVGQTITLPTAYSNANYKVQLTYLGIGFNSSNAGFLYSTTVSSSQFTIYSSNALDTNHVIWTTFGSII